MSDATAARVEASEAPQFGASDVRVRIMDVAEHFFAEEGYKSVSLRQITTRANVNIAAINYHFGSKLGLLRAVFERRAAPINAERMARLADCRRLRDERTLTVSDVLRAFIEPTLRGGHFAEGGQAYRRIMGRMSNSPIAEVRALLHEIYGDVAVEFIELLRPAMPDLDEVEFFWRLACVYGVMQYILADTGRLERLSREGFDMSDVDAALRYTLPVLTAGLTIPAIGGGDGS